MDNNYLFIVLVILLGTLSPALLILALFFH
jgi:hypothetical protein